MCSFCGRPRTLRNEQHQLGALVRTIVTCETCHRTLSSSMSVASSEPAAAEAMVMEPESGPEPAATAPTAKTLERPAAKRAPRKAAAAKATAAKTRTHKKTR